MKEQIKEAIKKQLEACEDTSLLDLVHQLLKKEGYAS